MEETKPKSSATKNYHLKMKVNGTLFECETSDLKKSILSFKPTLAVKTHVNFYCKNPEGNVCEKVILSKRAKMMWKNDIFLNMFINQLIFKSNA